ncbi:MAG: folate-binding protein YgfZ [Candidatus Thiodiazotropha sp.]
MNGEWQGFLEQGGASIAEGEVRDFGAPDTERGLALEADTLCDLSHDALIRVTGDDSSTFLQGQFTNDIREVSDSHHQLSSYCSPKGRILALFRVFKRQGAVYLQLPKSLLEPTLKRLRMFVLMSKVELTDASEELARFSLSGPNAEALLAGQLGDIPSEVDAATTSNGITVLRLTGVHPRFNLYGETQPMQQLWQGLSGDGARAIGSEAGRLQDIHAGIPTVQPDTIEAFVPQMLNLQLIKGVNFKKGCYTGQEVVARMQYLGKLKRRMYLLHSDNDTPPGIGDETYSPASASGQGAGKIVSVAQSAEGGYDILAVAEISSADGGELYLDEQYHNRLHMLELPYSVEQQENSPQAAE